MYKRQKNNQFEVAPAPVTKSSIYFVSRLLQVRSAEQKSPSKYIFIKNVSGTQHLNSVCDLFEKRISSRLNINGNHVLIIF